MAEESAGRPNQLLKNLSSKIASIPMILTALVIFVGGTIWTVVYSFTNSRLLPRLNFVGLDQYERLWGTPRWHVAIENIAVYGVWADATDDAANVPWPAARMREMAPLATGIQLADENLGARPARFASDANLARLDEIRARYDPDGRFHAWMGRL